jgi:hypothetical protein
MGNSGTSMSNADDDDEIDALYAIAAAIAPFFNMGHGVPPVSYIRAFIAVATKQGLTVDEYAKRVGISSTVMTRNLLDIGPLNRQRQPGLDPVMSERDPRDLRKHRYRLTPKGIKLRHDMYAAVRGRRRDNEAYTRHGRNT